MEYFTTDELRRKGRQILLEESRLEKSLAGLSKLAEFSEQREEEARLEGFDVFLSYRSKDEALVRGIHETLRSDYNLKVYVDVIYDPELDRSQVDGDTAKRIRERMNSSKCLFFINTTNVDDSIWMPWEVGYMDANTSRVAIYPIKDPDKGVTYGREFMDLYFHVKKGLNKNNEKRLWIIESPTRYVEFNSWLTGKDPFPRVKLSGVTGLRFGGR